jgi:hypothetical protein
MPTTRRSSSCNLLRRYRRGEKIGFTAVASLKSKGLLPRTGKTLRGKYVVGEKYKTRRRIRCPFTARI